jgi:tRNA-uridine 2-sulfurtransferase
MNRIRALGLLSGGLDSALAAKLLIDQGIEVIGLHLESPTACRSGVRDIARDLGIELLTRDKGAEYLRLLRHPRFGYGRNMNPCVDCRLFMFEIAKPLMREHGARFLFTGEVAGQRPMSQTRDRMTLIDREAALEGLILRPLSALTLPETEPEWRGWVDRSKLLGITGRARNVQLALAAQLGLRHFQSPGGGCLLTDSIFSAKLRDLFEHTAEVDTTMEDVALLRLGRHFRLRADLKIVLGRDAKENAALRAFEGDSKHLLSPVDFSGPTALICGAFDDASRAEAARLIARFTSAAGPADELSWDEAGTRRAAKVADLSSAAVAQLAAQRSASTGLVEAAQAPADTLWLSVEPHAT